MLRPACASSRTVYDVARSIMPIDMQARFEIKPQKESAPALYPRLSLLIDLAFLPVSVLQHRSGTL
jgi:hypothetical protein